MLQTGDIVAKTGGLPDREDPTKDRDTKLGYFDLCCFDFDHYCFNMSLTNPTSAGRLGWT